MAWLFPEDFGEEYRRQTQLLRLAALASGFLGLIFLVVHHATPYTLPYLLPVIWSVVDGTALVREKSIHPLIRVICDFLSAIFLVFDIPVMFFMGLIYMSFLTFVMGVLFMAAVCTHGLLSFRAGVEFWRQSRLLGRVQLPV
ncbi:uncharacterized protein LDX57_002819 [Aspergillus melleus]|uniref:uncharacterized protein n=1 Tax=Aspergillus melleus TaxID=138277 RepID=UPI001E8EAC0F|nr:uncharacterized protein LDX57_002819 [Aspergillus melleus]KAH8425071.1 hypothetical protein LDX57_002819 [Aspergillus melleus]